MNFFEQQDRAKRNTVRLVVLLCLAVISLIVFTTIAVVLIVAGLSPESVPGQPGAQGWIQRAISLLDAPLVATVSLAVISVVVLGGLFKHIQLGAGGKAVAEALNGRLIQATTTDPDERRILNVVEEMAIAAGTPVPPVYIIEDDSINAFAAGRTPQDAVIGMTRGSIRLLNRSELQGVVAHEFSHIFHGDMRLNIRLVATLHGILLIGLVGYFLLRTAPFRRSNNRDNTAFILLAIGIVLIVVGFAGTFFGNLIKSAVSRQREFLADASAVQFTRNPDGIAGALKKIGGYQAGSRLQAPNATEYSHMFFGQAVGAFGGLTATHPPLAQRIRRLQPNWDGKFVTPQPVSNQPASAHGQPGGVQTPASSDQAATVLGADAQTWGRDQPAPTSGASAMPGAPAITKAATGLGLALGAGAATPASPPPRSAPAQPLPPESAQQAIDAIGQPQPRHLAYARRMLAELPPELHDAAHEAYSARALVYGLLLSPDDHVRAQQLDDLREQAEADVVAALHSMLPRLQHLDPRHRLPLLELSLPALRQLSSSQYTRFKRCLGRLITADNHISLMEWALHRLVVHHLEGETPSRKSADLAHYQAECELLLSAVTRSGVNPAGQVRGENDASEQAHAAFVSAARELPFKQMRMTPSQGISAPALEAAVIRLSHLSPGQKPALLNALARAVEHDGQVTAVEAELLRAISDTLECPLPPLLQPEFQHELAAGNSRVHARAAGY